MGKYHRPHPYHSYISHIRSHNPDQSTIYGAYWSDYPVLGSGTHVTECPHNTNEHMRYQLMREIDPGTCHLYIVIVPSASLHVYYNVVTAPQRVRYRKHCKRVWSGANVAQGEADCYVCLETAPMCNFHLIRLHTIIALILYKGFLYVFKPQICFDL